MFYLDDIVVFDEMREYVFENDLVSYGERNNFRFSLVPQEQGFYKDGEFISLRDSRANVVEGDEEWKRVDQVFVRLFIDGEATDKSFTIYGDSPENIIKILEY